MFEAPQILHGRNTLQKYVEYRELPKVTKNDGEPKAIRRSWHTIVTQCLIYVFICWSHRKRQHIISFQQQVCVYVSWV